MKASNVFAPTKAQKVVPDLEEAHEEDDDDEVVAEEQADSAEPEDGDITKDNYIKKPKVSKGDASKKTPAKGGKKFKGDEEIGSGWDGDAKPKKARGGKEKAVAGKSKARK